jgi:hypothetical protein
MSLLRPDISNTPERRSAFGLAVTAASSTPSACPQPSAACCTRRRSRRRAGGRGARLRVLAGAVRRPSDILGATIRLDGKPFTIVGVTERGFFGLNVGRRFDVAIALNGYARCIRIRSTRSGTASRSSDDCARANGGGGRERARALQPRIRATCRLPDNVPF